MSLLPRLHFHFTFIFHLSHLAFTKKKLIGKRGKDSQSTMHGLHQRTGAMFFAEINKNAVSCWNSRGALRPTSMTEVARDNVTLVYPSDLSVRHWRDEFWREFKLKSSLSRFRSSMMICGCCPTGWCDICTPNSTLTTTISGSSERPSTISSAARNARNRRWNEVRSIESRAVSAFSDQQDWKMATNNEFR